MRRSATLTDLTPQDLLLLRKNSKATVGITVRIGGKKIHLPVEALTLTSDDKGLFTFVSLPAVVAILGSTSTGSEVIREDEKAAALKSLRGTITRTKRAPKASGAKAAAILTPEAEKALAAIEAWSKANNVRVVPDASGGYKVRKIRGKRQA